MRLYSIAKVIFHIILNLMVFKFTHKAADIPGTCNSQDTSLPRFHLKEFHYTCPTNWEDPVVTLKKIHSFHWENSFFHQPLISSGHTQYNLSTYKESIVAHSKFLVFHHIASKGEPLNHMMLTLFIKRCTS